MRPVDLRTRIFLDSGDPAETREALSLLGFLDGQTTNPTLIARSPGAVERLSWGRKFSEREAYDFYQRAIKEISDLIPQGSISIEVYADAATTPEQMVEQGKEFFAWIPNAHIKFPCTYEGMKAAYLAVKKGIRVNMTLCFSQEQAAAVHSLTVGAPLGDVFVSPFIGRLDDGGENGVDLVVNILNMYQRGESHVQVLAASVRTLDHLLYCLQMGVDIITAPLSVLKLWASANTRMPGPDFKYDAGRLAPIPYREVRLGLALPAYNLMHPLTDAGIKKFVADWKAIIK